MQNHAIQNVCGPLSNHPRRRGVFSLLTRLEQLYRSRRTLSQLDAARLDDLGITPEQATREAKRAVWDVPANWIK